MKVSLSSKQKFFISRVFPLMFVVAGAGAALFGMRELIRARPALDWPSTQGKVVASSVEHRRGTRGNGRSRTSYLAKVLYEFSVEGTMFNGDRIAYGEYGSSSPSDARRIVDRYPRGKSVTVYYMPDNPEECLLEPGLKSQLWFLLGFGLIFVTVGSLTAVFLPRVMRKQEITEPSNALDSE